MPEKESIPVVVRLLEVNDARYLFIRLLSLYQVMVFTATVLHKGSLLRRNGPVL